MAKQKKQNTEVIPEDVPVIDAQVPEQETAKKQVDSRRNYLRRLLTDDKSYKRKYSPQLTLAAQSLLLLKECYAEIMMKPSGERMTITEISREDNSRTTESPLVTLYIKLDTMCRKNLRALGMNAEAVATAITEVTVENNDPLKALMEKMK